MILILSNGDSDDSMCFLADAIASSVTSPSDFDTSLALMSRDLTRASFGPSLSSRELRVLAACSKSPMSRDIECLRRSMANDAISPSSLDRSERSNESASDNIEEANAGSIGPGSLSSKG